MSEPFKESGDTSAEPSVPHAHLPVGHSVGGKYVIKRLIGEGANGAVYEGEHTAIGHRVAIKVVHRALSAREDIVARFRLEARICGTIRNRHVGQVYDVGELPDGAPYMVMELHEGRSLAEVIVKDKQLPLQVILDFCRQLLNGLQAAHDSGAIHRDVKPDNIMVVRESSGHSIIKLVDFGIGKSIVADISTRAVTQDGMVVGSPDYMPPEQLRGGPVDHRVDIYAVGVVLYELVAGRMPFDAETLTELFVAILRDPVKPPRDLRRDCPVELERVIMRALSRDADQRFQSAAEMERALAEVPGVGVASDEQLRRYSEPAPPMRTPEVRAKQTSAGYALESERVRTAELQIPIRRGASRPALFALGAASVGAVLFLWWTSSDDAGVPAASVRASVAAAGNVVSAPAPAPVAAPASAPTPQPVAPAEGVEQRAPDPLPEVVSEVPIKSDRARATRRQRAASDAREAVSPSATPAPPQPAPVSASGTSASALVQEANAALVLGQIPRAAALYREATEKAPTHAAAWRGLGMVSNRMGAREEAARAFKKYLALRPDAPDAAAIQQKLDEL